MNYNELFQLIKEKKSFLCVGLDTDLNKIPEALKSEADPCFTFNKEIIDATLPYAAAYKPNLAFYEAQGSAGWENLKKTLKYLRSKTDDIFIIADAKRGDIGNTSGMYAQAFFNELKVDAVTLSPYMGKDTVSPFLEYENRWTILLALTSNASAADFQYFENEKGEKLFEKVIDISRSWGTKDQLMYVVGATKAEALKEIREIIPEHFLLVPGVGAQGGSLSEVAKYGMNEHCGLLVNSSRGILYASSDKGFAEKAGEKARELQQEMTLLLRQHRLI